MSKLIENRKPQIQIGEYVPVISTATPANGGTGTFPSTAYGELIPCDAYYNQSDYPDLYAKIGIIGANLYYTPRPMPSSLTVRSVTYGNNLYVAINSDGNQGWAITSTNNITWTASVLISFTYNVQTLTYGNGLYITGDDSGIIKSSTNGTSWTTRTTIGQIAFDSIYNNGLYIVCFSSGNLRTSTDALTWTSRTSGTTNGISSLTYGNGIYVYGGAGGVLATSTDGTTWTSRTSGTASTINALTYGNGIYVYGGVGGVLATSTNGTTWTAQNSGTVSNINALTYGNGIYVFSTSQSQYNVYTSTNAITWTSRSAAPDKALYMIGGGAYIWTVKYLNGVYIAAGSDSFYGTSTNPTLLQYSPYYDASTQFYVPPYASNSLTVSTYTSYTTPSINAYVRAK